MARASCQLVASDGPFEDGDNQSTKDTERRSVERVFIKALNGRGLVFDVPLRRWLGTITAAKSKGGDVDAEDAIKSVLCETEDVRLRPGDAGIDSFATGEAMLGFGSLLVETIRLVKGQGGAPAVQQIQ